jgi:DNA-binding NarL/FixJ family response regulator
MPVTVLVVDDHPLIRETVTNLLEACDDLRVVGQCADGSEVPAAVSQLRPDVVLMDLQMPVDGLTAARAVRASHPDVRILILSGGLSAAAAHEARAVGVAGYRLKDEPPDELPVHVRAVAAGGTAWATRVLQLLTGAGLAPPSTTGTPPHIEGLPNRLRPPR